MPKKIKAPKKETKKANYLTNPSDMLSYKAEERRRIPAPGAKYKENKDWQRWWLADEDDIGAQTELVIEKIEQEQETRFTNFMNWARIYGNWEATSYFGSFNANQQDMFDMPPLRLNLTQSGIDTCTAKIAKDKMQPYIITTGSNNYFDKLDAEEATRFLKGVMQKVDDNTKSSLQFRDSQVFGTGAVHFYFDPDGKPQLDWVSTIELRVADFDGMDENPRSLHRVRLIAKDKVKAMFPDKAEIIDELQADESANRLRQSNNIVETMRLKQSWHLATSSKTNDGYYTATVGDTCLVKEPYTCKRFPIVVNRWAPKMLGFFGRSVVEEVYSLQMSLDDLLNTASQSWSVVGVPYWLIPMGSKVPTDQLEYNDIARVIEYYGETPPTLQAPEPLPASFYNWVNWHKEMIFAIIGISQAQATSENQLGPNASGEAIQQIVDIETTRFSDVSERWMTRYKDLAAVIIEQTAKFAETNPKTDLTVQYIDKWKQVKSYSFKNFKLDNFIIGCDVISGEPNKVEGRIQTTDDYVQRNWITPLRAMEIENLDPDLQEEVRRKISTLNLVEMQMSNIVKENTLNGNMPNPYMIDLHSCQTLAQEIVNLLTLDGCPSDRLELCYQYINQLVQLQQDPTYSVLNPPPQQAPAAQPQSMPAGPQGMPAQPLPPQRSANPTQPQQ